MASYNELNALIDAYINRNGVQAITGQILNGVLKAMVEQLGRGYTIMGAAIPTTDPGTPDGPECYFASEAGTYTDFDGLQIVPGELALLCYTPSDGWTKETIYEGFQEVQATIDGNVGTPSVGVSYANGVLSFDFHNMKGNPGQNGQDGQDGDPAGFGTIGADITGGVGTPGVTVDSSGPATAKNLQFHFTNLKGETGVTSVLATVDNTTGTPTCTVSLVGQQLTLAFSGLKGAQGDTGVSAEYPIAIVNNLTTDDAASALSAAQGVVLQGEITQLEAEINDGELVDLSALTSYTALINSSEVWANDPSVAPSSCVFLPVTPGEKYVLLCVATEAHYAFLKQNAPGENTSTPLWASGYSGRTIIHEGDKVTLTAPNDATSLYLRKTVSSGINILPEVYTGGGIIERLQIQEEKIDNIRLPWQIEFKAIAGAGIAVSDGTVYNVASRCYTDYIDLTGINKILYTRHVSGSASNNFGMAFYDENKAYISSEAGGANAELPGSYDFSVITVPSTAKYARFTLWANRNLGDFFVMNAEADAVASEVLIPYMFPYKVPITGDYFNLQDDINTHVLIRANVYMPYNGGCAIKFKQKGETSYQYAVNAASLDGSHTISATTISSYRSGDGMFTVEGQYNYIYVIFKNGSDAAVSVEDILSAYDIVFSYKNEVPSLTLNEGEIKWNFYGAFVQSTGRLLLTDYVAIPKQFMTLRIDIPEWMRVRFQYGLRNEVGWTGYYYSGDVVTFTREQSALKMELTLIDGRGLNVGIYERDAVGNKMSLTILDEKDDSIIQRNFGAEKYLGAVRATPNVNDAELPVIVHTSDIHGDARRFNAAYDFADYLGARILVNTGDNPFYQMSQGILFHEKIVSAHKTDFVNCIGNHDTYASAIATVYNENIAPFAEDFEYHKLSGSDVSDKCYFYKDLSDRNIRIIAMDIYEGIVNAVYKARISSTQFNWFIATLASTPAGYGVIIITHQAPHTISAVSGKTDFNDATMDSQTNAIDSDYMQYGKITGNPFGKVIDAFVAGGTVSGSYTQKNAAFTDNETISYEADFTNLAEGVEFIAYLNGHTHRDFIGYVADCEHKQLNLNVTCAPPISQSSGYKTASDIFRDSVGANQDAFNVYTINRTDKTVGIARIGSNLSKDLRPRKVMFVSYVD